MSDTTVFPSAGHDQTLPRPSYAPNGGGQEPPQWEWRDLTYLTLLRLKPTLGVVAIVTAFMIAFASFHGWREIIGNDAIAIPAVVAGASSFILWAAWHLLFKVTPNIVSSRRLSHLLLVCASIIGIQTSYSAWPMTVASSGSDAVNFHEASHTTRVRAAVEKAFQADRAQEPMIGKTEGEAAQLKAKGELEAVGGLTGMSGSSVVVQAYMSAGTQLEQMAHKMEEQLAEAKRQYDIAQGLMRQEDALVADKSIPSEERERQFGDIDTRIHDPFTAMNDTDLTAILSHCVAGVVRGWKTTQQRDALNDEAHLVEDFCKEIRSEAEAMRKNTVEPQLPVFVPMTPGRAVIAYMKEVPMGWAASLGLDLITGLLLVAWMIVWRAVHLEEHDDDPLTLPGATVYQETPRAPLPRPRPRLSAPGVTPRWKPNGGPPSGQPAR